MSRTISVILTDDHPMVLQGIKACLEESGQLEVTGLAPDGETLLELYAETPCDVVVLDINLPGISGLETIEHLEKLDPGAKALIFSMHQNVEYARRAVRAGACGFVLKDALPAELILAIQTVAQGGTFFSPQIARALATAQTGSAPVALTDRETEVLQAMADGKSSKIIAFDIGVSVRTVEAHRRNLKQKLGAKSTAECISIAFTAGLINSQQVR